MIMLFVINIVEVIEEKEFFIFGERMKVNLIMFIINIVFISGNMEIVNVIIMKLKLLRKI